MLNVFVLNVFMLSVIMLNVVMLSVVAPILALNSLVVSDKGRKLYNIDAYDSFHKHFSVVTYDPSKISTAGAVPCRVF
jgi:hypothetical protein